VIVVARCGWVERFVDWITVALMVQLTMLSSEQTSARAFSLSWYWTCVYSIASRKSYEHRKNIYSNFCISVIAFSYPSLLLSLTHKHTHTHTLSLSLSLFLSSLSPHVPYLLSSCDDLTCGKCMFVNSNLYT